MSKQIASGDSAPQRLLDIDFWYSPQRTESIVAVNFTTDNIFPLMADLFKNAERIEVIRPSYLDHSLRRGMKWNDYPAINVPAPRATGTLTKDGMTEWNRMNVEGTVVLTRETRFPFPHEMEGKDRIVLYGLSNDSDYVSAAATLVMLCGNDQRHLEKHPWAERVTFVSDEVMESEISVSEFLSTSLVTKPMAKMHFWTNWNSNFVAIGGKCLEFHVYKGPRSPIFDIKTPVALQMLFAAENGEILPSTTTGEVMWTGTGKYPPVTVERTVWKDIVHSYRKCGFIEDGTADIVVTERGRAFLADVHPNCKDPDLPARLKMWIEDWPNSRPAMDSYIKSFFGKWKTLLDKR